MCIYLYIYLSLSLSIYIYIHMCTYIYIYIYFSGIFQWTFISSVALSLFERISTGTLSAALSNGFAFVSPGAQSLEQLPDGVRTAGVIYIYIYIRIKTSPWRTAAPSKKARVVEWERTGINKYMNSYMCVYIYIYIYIYHRSAAISHWCIVLHFWRKQALDKLALDKRFPLTRSTQFHGLDLPWWRRCKARRLHFNVFFTN